MAFSMFSIAFDLVFVQKIVPSIASKRLIVMAQNIRSVQFYTKQPTYIRKQSYFETITDCLYKN